eukprot:669891-Hanusia_phi.AAC.1
MVPRPTSRAGRDGRGLCRLCHVHSDAGGHGSCARVCSGPRRVGQSASPTALDESLGQEVSRRPEGRQQETA